MPISDASNAENAMRCVCVVPWQEQRGRTDKKSKSHPFQEKGAVPNKAGRLVRAQSKSTVLVSDGLIPLLSCLLRFLRSAADDDGAGSSGSAWLSAGPIDDGLMPLQVP